MGTMNDPNLYGAWPDHRLHSELLQPDVAKRAWQQHPELRQEFPRETAFIAYVEALHRFSQDTSPETRAAWKGM